MKAEWSLPGGLVYVIKTNCTVHVGLYVARIWFCHRNYNHSLYVYSESGSDVLCNHNDCIDSLH